MTLLKKFNSCCTKNTDHLLYRYLVQPNSSDADMSNIITSRLTLYAINFTILTFIYNSLSALSICVMIDGISILPFSNPTRTLNQHQHISQYHTPAQGQSFSIVNNPDSLYSTSYLTSISETHKHI